MDLAMAIWNLKVSEVVLKKAIQAGDTAPKRKQEVGASVSQAINFSNIDSIT